MCVQWFCTILLFNILVVWIDMAILTNLLFWQGAGQCLNNILAVRQSQRNEAANQSQHISFFGRRAFIKP